MGRDRHTYCLGIVLSLMVAVWMSAGVAAPFVAAQSAATGTIKGRVRLTSPPPANPIIRMGVDPLCSRANSGTTRPTQQYVVVGAEGGLADTFVQLDGTLPASPVPTEPVVINQKKCVYAPRVVGAQPGQTLRVINSDTMLHNVHIKNSTVNAFDTTQPQSGMVFNYTLKKDATMLRLACSVHSWMTAYIGVVPHPFFAVSSDSGTFTIARVPPGKYTVRTWHERYGRLTRTVDVTAGGTATVELAYTGTEKPQAALVPQLLIGG